MAKKKKKEGGGGCPLIILYDRGAVRVFASYILHQITIVCIQICSCSLSKQLFGKIFSCNIEKSPLNTDFKRLYPRKEGAVIWRWQNQGLSFVKKGGCSFAVGTQTQRVSATPPPPPLGRRPTHGTSYSPPL